MTDPTALRTETRPARIDAMPKLTGRLRYASDIAVHDLLHARLVLSPHAHAEILAIDRRRALEAPGVVAVLEAADLPIAAADETRMFSPLARGEAVFAGQPVAIVVAETEAAAADGAALVEVSYEPLPAAVDPAKALRPGAPLARIQRAGTAASLENVHGAIGAPQSSEITDEPLSDNVAKRCLYTRGDAAAALADAASAVETTVETGWVHQVPMETQVATARIEDDGGLLVESSTQAVFLTQQGLADVYGLPIGRVRVAATPMGGSFGSKFFLVDPLVAGAALALRAPVRLAMTRSEDLLAGNPAAAATISVRIGAGADGRLGGLEGRLVFDDGAFAELGSEGLGAFCVGGPYRWDAVHVKSLGVETNRFGTGAYRAPGASQALFATECAIDDLAAELGRDPIEMRLANLAEEGEVRVDGGTWPRHGARECLELLRDHPLWRGRAELPENEGVGVACGIWTGARDSAGAICSLDPDGGMTVVTGVADMTGVQSTYQALAAAALDLPLEMVRVVAADSQTAPYAPPSGGSSAMYVTGAAVRKAAMEVRRQVLDAASDELEAAVEDLEVTTGRVNVKGVPAAAIEIASLAEDAWSFGGRLGPFEAHSTTLVDEIAPLTSANLAHVRVDPRTGAVEVLAMVAVQDVGRALHPALIEEQMHGGVVQGIGRALLEELVHDEDGRLLTDSLMSYAIPVAADAPAIETHFVEVPCEHGPLGARGVGEGSVLAVPAAIGNAIKAAAGVRMRRLPMTAQRVWRQLASRTAASGIQ